MARNYYINQLEIDGNSIIVVCHYVPPSLSNGEVERKVLVTVHVPVCRQLNCRLWAAIMFGL